MKLKLTFNEDHIALIKNIRFDGFGDNVYGIDRYSVWGGTFIYEDIASIIGIRDHVDPRSLEDPSGPIYPEEDMARMTDLAEFIMGNLKNIEEILHQFCFEGIKTDVVYWCYPNEHIWHKE